MHWSKIEEISMESEQNQEPWQRVQPISLLFVVIATLKQWIIPVVFGLFSAREGNLVVIGLGSFAFAIVLAFAITRFLTLRFRLAGGELQVRDGIFFKSIRTVPVKRIQNIDLVQNVMHRMFRVAEVRIETASGKEPEAVLRVLSLAEVERLRERVFAQATAQDRSLKEPAFVMHAEGLVPPVAGSPASQVDRPQRLLLTISLKQFALAGLTSNRGLLVVPIVLGTLYEARGLTRSFRDRFRFNSSEFFRDQFRFNSSDFFVDRLPAGFSTLTVVAWLTVGLIVSLALLKLFSFAWFVIRFYGYQLWSVGDDLRISCGLLTKVSATIPRSRIQFISIHRSWLGRRLGIATVRIETAGGGGSEHENASQSVGRRWFVPVISESQLVELVENLRPGIRWTESTFDWQPLSPLAGSRLQRFGILATVVLTAVAGFVWQPWGATVGIIILPVFLWLANRQAKAMRYARCGPLVVFRSGLMTRKCSCAFIDKIQSLQLSESPFDRRWRMATLTVDTAAAGPAEHRIEVKYLDATVAQHEFTNLKAAIA
jgi:putative membrane protein